MKGYVHSTESFGSVDGPGVRFVVFVQGCPMRCKYCHNPDTWTPSIGKQMDTDEILQAYESNKAFYTNGGLTVTGGEPLMQIDFVTELFEKAKAKGIHTCLDTSGIIFNPDNEELMKKFDRLVKSTDLVMLDIKHIDPEEHIKLTQQKNTNILKFAKYLDAKHIDLWIRHVVVPTITYNEKYLRELGRFIGTLSNLKALDVLPYHKMGVVKYEALNMDYVLKDLPALDQSDALKAKEFILEGIKEVRGM